jgi:hypothetical protein
VVSLYGFHQVPDGAIRRVVEESGNILNQQKVGALLSGVRVM